MTRTDRTLARQRASVVASTGSLRSSDSVTGRTGRGSRHHAPARPSTGHSIRSKGKSAHPFPPPTDPDAPLHIIQSPCSPEHRPAHRALAPHCDESQLPLSPNPPSWPKRSHAPDASCGTPITKPALLCRCWRPLAHERRKLRPAQQRRGLFSPLAGEAHAMGFEPSNRVHRLILHVHLGMQMWAGALTFVAYQRNDLSCLHRPGGH